MKYSCEISIDKNIEDVIKTFIDYSQMHLWQPGLKKIDHKGKPHRKDSVSFLVFEFDHQEMVMKETIEDYQYPNLYIAIYEVPNVWNRCVNHFQETEEGTHWIMESEFIFKEKADQPISAFENKTLTAMKMFKTYIENK